MSMFSWMRARMLLKKKNDVLARGLTMGAGCEILNDWDFGSEPYLVTIGSNVRISSGVKITTHDGGVWTLRHLYPELSDIDRFGRVEIGDNCHIGANAIVLPGVTIGSNCVVGAGAVVTRDIPSGSIAVGVPARVICGIEDYRNKHKLEFIHSKKLPPDKKRIYVESHI